MPGYFEHFLVQVSRGHLRHTLVLCLALYALMLPVMVLAERGYTPAPMPHGRKVEQVFPRLDSRWVAEVHTFTTADEWRRIVVYENATLLPSDRYEAKPFNTNGWSSVVLNASDDTNPTRNGRRYYVVLP